VQKNLTREATASISDKRDKKNLVSLSLEETLAKKAELGTSELEQHWNSLASEMQAKLTGSLDKYQAIAAQVDHTLPERDLQEEIDSN